MQQALRCRLLICRGQEKSSEEAAQQQFSSFYSNQVHLKNQNFIDRGDSGTQNGKEIFSFKLNNFRNYGDSDKNCMRASQHAQNFKEPRFTLHNCKSTQRKLNHIAQSQFLNGPRQHLYYCSPPPKNQLYSPSNFQTSIKFTSPPKIMAQPTIAFTVGSNKTFGSEANEIRSKKSQETQYSLKQSEVKVKMDQRMKVVQAVSPKKHQPMIHYQNNIQSYGNETERTLIDTLNDEFYKTKQGWKTKEKDSHKQSIPNKPKFSNCLSQQPKVLSFKNHQQTLKINSPIKASLAHDYVYSIKQMKNLNSNVQVKPRQRVVLRIA